MQTSENKTVAPKVSVCVVTYNQDKYIRQCLQSLVDQETNFPFEVIVADDCSTDNTAKIVREFSERYPNIIKPVWRERNIGAYENFRLVHDCAISPYVCHMDGDDYALQGKLQTQADFLDQNPKCNLVWTPVLIETEPGVLHEQNVYFKEHALLREYTRADLIKYGTIGVNSSKMYRRTISDQPTSNPDFEFIDYFINFFQIGNGVACFVGNKPLGVYRAGIGIASTSGKTKYLTLKSIEFFAASYPEYRLECNVAILFRCLADIKNKRKISHLHTSLFFKTIHWKSIFVLLREMRFMKSVTLKNKNA